MIVRWGIAGLLCAGFTMAFGRNLAATVATSANVTKTEATEPYGRVVGTIYCSDTHKVARGAEVILLQPVSPGRKDGVRRVIPTDLDGRYSFDTVSPGEYTLITHLVGYIAAPEDSDRLRGGDLQGRWSSIRLTVHPGETVTIDITLMRGASVAGRVLFPDGTAAISATIFAFREEKPDKPGDPPKDVNLSSPMSGSTTDDHGRFRVFGLPPGTYRIAVAPHMANYGILKVLRSDDYLASNSVMFYSGDTYRRSKAKTYDLKGGDEVSGTDITIPLDELHRVAGTAIADDGRMPNSGLLTLLDTSENAVLFRTDIKPGGTFSFVGVPPGSYKLTLTHAFIAKPDATGTDYDPDGADIPIVAFSDTSIAVLVSGDDVLDLQFQLKEIPLAPELKTPPGMTVPEVP